MNFENFDEALESFVSQVLLSVKNIPSGNLLAKGQQLQQLSSIVKKITAAQEALANFVTTEQNNLLEMIKIEENNLIQARNMLLGGNAKAITIVEEPQQEPQSTWLNVVKPSTKSSKTKIKYTPVSAQPPQQVRREVSDGVYIMAYTISSPAGCHDFRGYWCYIPEYDRYYLSLNNIILEAITANIIPAEIPPSKCLEHRNITVYGHAKGVDWTKSKFYVPRQYDPESKDVRQFTARMKFVPASKELRENEIYTYRIGSRDTLRDDIQQIKPEDKRLYNDLVGNYLLCYTAANQ